MYELPSTISDVKMLLALTLEELGSVGLDQEARFKHHVHLTGGCHVSAGASFSLCETTLCRQSESLLQLMIVFAFKRLGQTNDDNTTIIVISGGPRSLRRRLDCSVYADLRRVTI
jgi:hypothetical protein